MINSDLFLYLRRTFAAPRELVFRVWTEPQALESWFKPMGRRTKVVALDLRVGGGYCFEMRSPEGETYVFSGHYVEIVPPQKLAFTWVGEATGGIETLVTVEFLERSGSTEIALKHERFSSDEMVIGHQAGWNWMFDELTTFVSSS